VAVGRTTSLENGIRLAVCDHDGIELGDVRDDVEDFVAVLEVAEKRIVLEVKTFEVLEGLQRLKCVKGLDLVAVCPKLFQCFDFFDPVDVCKSIDGKIQNLEFFLFVLSFLSVF